MSININQYKNIVFDLGGVLLNIDNSLSLKAFSDLGFPDFSESFLRPQIKEMFDQFEKGLIATEDFRNRLKAYSKSPIDNATLDTAWNAMLLDFPSERLILLQKIKTSHRTFLLSNTNGIHIEAIYKDLQKAFKIGDLSGFFEKVYLSCNLGMRKPDLEIFELVLSENNLLPGETLFIDDSIPNIESAKKMGIQTYWLDVKKESITDLIKS